MTNSTDAAVPGVEDAVRRLIGDSALASPERLDRLAGAVLDLFASILAEKEREIADAKADLAKLMDPELKHLRIEDGSIDVALTGPIVQHMGLVISEHFRASGAENYIEMCYHTKTEPFETYVWTIQKRVGRNSPHELRAKAEARALSAEAERDQLKIGNRVLDELVAEHCAKRLSAEAALAGERERIAAHLEAQANALWERCETKRTDPPSIDEQADAAQAFALQKAADAIRAQGK